MSLCVSIWVYMYLHTGVFEVQNSISDTLNLEGQATISHKLMWVLGIELWSYENAASSFNQ